MVLIFLSLVALFLLFFSAAALCCLVGSNCFQMQISLFFFSFLNRMVGNLPCILFILHCFSGFDFQGVLHDTIYKVYCLCIFHSRKISC